MLYIFILENQTQICIILVPQILEREYILFPIQNEKNQHISIFVKRCKPIMLLIVLRRRVTMNGRFLPSVSSQVTFWAFYLEPLKRS